MAKNQIMFYATEVDLGSVLSPLETELPLQYTLTGLFKVNKPQTVPSYANIPGFGRAVHPTAAANPSYLLLPQGTEVYCREVPQKSGGMLFGVDQRCNEDSIVLRPAGRYGNDIILCGMLGTVSQELTSKRLYEFVKKRLRNDFQKRREFFVGHEALDAWKAGVRLTIGASSPPEFDLRP
jgi:hypothetical protein